MEAIDCMKEAIKTFEERSKVYGESYKIHGRVMAEIFPKGIKLETPEDFSRFLIFNMQIGKLIRYSQSWSERHIDSSHDCGVYSFMQEELDQKYHENIKRMKEFKL